MNTESLSDSVSAHCQPIGICEMLEDSHGQDGMKDSHHSDASEVASVPHRPLLSLLCDALSSGVGCSWCNF